MNTDTHTSETHKVNNTSESNSSSKTTTVPPSVGSVFPQTTQGLQGSQGLGQQTGTGGLIGSTPGVGPTSHLPPITNTSNLPSSGGYGSSAGGGGQPEVAVSHGNGGYANQGPGYGNSSFSGGPATSGAAGATGGAIGTEDAVKGGHASSQGISARGPGSGVGGAPDYDSRTTAVHGVNDPVTTPYAVHDSSTSPATDVSETHPNPTHVSNQYRPGTAYNTAPVAGDGAQLHGAPPPAYKENINSSVNLPQHKPI